VIGCVERSFFNEGVVVDPGDVGAVRKWESEQAFASDGLYDARIFPRLKHRARERRYGVGLEFL
jgi:hypothetical protein